MMTRSSYGHHHCSASCAAANTSARISLVLDTALLAVSILVILVNLLGALLIT